MKMTRCLIAEKKLPKSFWIKAIYTTTYLSNRLPTRVVQEKTSIEAWIGVKPFVTLLQIFGSICYIHVAVAKSPNWMTKMKRGFSYSKVIECTI